MSIERNLREMGLSRETYWLRYPGTSPFKLRRPALTVRHCLHVLPGERILELGAGSGLWTEHLTAVHLAGTSQSSVSDISFATQRIKEKIID